MRSVMRKSRSWREKLLDSKDLPKVVPINGKMSTKWGAGDVLIPAPIEVDALMKRVPKGKLTTVDHLRKSLAAAHNATIACPITTGIFAWIAAHAADEDVRQRNAKRPTPYWRTLKNNGEINPKYPGGIPALKKLLQSEGHTVIQKGKRFFIPNYDQSLATLS
jgi:hypothetical protein